MRLEEKIRDNCRRALSRRFVEQIIPLWLGDTELPVDTQYTIAEMTIEQLLQLFERNFDSAQRVRNVIVSASRLRNCCGELHKSYLAARLDARVDEPEPTQVLAFKNLPRHEQEHYVRLVSFALRIHCGILQEMEEASVAR